MGLFKRATKTFDGIIFILAVLGAAIMVFLMLLVGIEVGLRHFFGITAFWVTEICEYLILFVAFLGATYVLKKNAHVSVEIAYDMLKPRHQVLLDIITSILSTIACLVVTWYGFKATWLLFQNGYFPNTILKPPLFLIVGIIPIGTLMLSIQLMRRTYGYIVSQKRSQEEKSS